MNYWYLNSSSFFGLYILWALWTLESRNRRERNWLICRFIINSIGENTDYLLSALIQFLATVKVTKTCAAAIVHWIITRKFVLWANKEIYGFTYNISCMSYMDKNQTHLFNFVFNLPSKIISFMDKWFYCCYRRAYLISHIQL